MPAQDMSAINLIENERNMHLLPQTQQPMPMMAPMPMPMALPQMVRPAMGPYAAYPQMLPQPVMMPQTEQCGYGCGGCTAPCATPIASVLAAPCASVCGAHHHHKANQKTMAQPGVHIHYHPVRGAPDYMGPIMSIAMMVN